MASLSYFLTKLLRLVVGLLLQVANDGGETSATSITMRRSQRSMRALARGPSRTPGSMEMRVAIARMVADPIWAVIHRINPNWATALPTQERVWPVQMVKNKGAHSLGFQVMERIGMVVKVYQK